MTSSLLIKILKIDYFGDFSCAIDYSIRTEVFRDVICYKDVKIFQNLHTGSNLHHIRNIWSKFDPIEFPGASRLTDVHMDVARRS